MLLAGMMAFTSCSEDEKIIYDSADATAPSIGTIADAVLELNGEPLVISYSAVNFNLTVPYSQVLYISASQDFSDPQRVNATFGESTVSIAQADLNSALLNKGAVAEEPFTTYFRIYAYINNDKATSIQSTEILSDIVSANITPYNADVFEVDSYEHVWVIGNYCGWAFDNASLQYLYKYGSDDVYSGIIDFGGMAADGWKLTGIAGWDDSCNWGTDGSAIEDEAASITLISAGSSSDIKAYSKRYYYFSFDRNSLALSKKWGFDTIGLCGSFNSWDAAGATTMTYNPKMVRFYCDVTLEAGAEIKVVADGAWDLNWGANCEVGGGNVSVTEAGNYRVYLDLNKNEFKLDANMYGKDEPGMTGGGDVPPVVDKPTAWSLIGTINGDNWSADIDMTNTTGDTWIVRSVTLTESDEFKIRADHDWTTAWGGTEENATSTIDASNAYGVFKPTLGTAFAKGDVNIAVGVAGVYDITLDYAAETILIEEHVTGYSLIGEINGDSWATDYLMNEADGLWTSPVVNITGGFKIRYDYSWDDANCYGVAEGFTPTIGEAFTAVQPGANITVPEAGDYRVTFNPATLEVTITAVAFPETMYMIGQEFGSWDWASDGIVELVPVHSGEGQFWTVRYFTANQGFKFCSKREWSGDFWGLTTNDGFTESGGNCTVTEDGFYLVHIDLKREMVHVEPARIYGIGDCFGGWDAKMEGALFTANGKTLTTTLANDGELRMYVESDIADTDWWTREFIILDGQIVYRGTGDDQQRVSCVKGQTVTLDPNAGTGTIQ